MTSTIRTLTSTDLIDLHLKVAYPGGLNPMTARAATVEEAILFEVTLAELERRADLAGRVPMGTSDDDDDNDAALEFIASEYGLPHTPGGSPDAPAN